MRKTFLTQTLSLCLMCFAGSSIAVAQEEYETQAIDLSLSTAVLFALEENPDLLIAGEKIEQLEEFISEKKADYWPRVELSAEGGRQYITPNAGKETNNYGNVTLQVTQKVFDGYATSSQVNQREELTNSERYKALNQRERVVLNTMTFYLDVLLYQSEIATAERFVNEIDKMVQVISEMYQAGAISKAMHDYAVSRQASAYLDLNRAKASYNDAVSNLEFLTGALPDFAAVDPDVLNPEKYDFDVYFALAQEQNSRVKINDADLSALKHKLAAEKGGYYPQLDFNVSAEQAHDDGGDVGRQRDVKAYVSMRYEIFDGFFKKHRKNRVNSEIRELEYREMKIVKELKRELQLAYNQIVAIQDAVKAVHLEIKTNTAVKILNKENFRLGNINVIELIEGEERLKAAYQKRHRLKYDFYLNSHSFLINSTIVNDEYFCASCTEDF